MKLKIYKAILAILLIAFIIVLGLIIAKYFNSQKNEELNQETVETFSNINTQENEKIEMQGYEVIGIVKIPKISMYGDKSS